MYDIHAHVLPGIDDGPTTLEDALRGVSALAREGIEHIVATPHFSRKYPRVSAREVEERTRGLERLAHQADIPVRLYAGHEVRLDAQTEAALTSGQAATINDGPYVLLELGSRERQDRLPDAIDRLRTIGFVPILSHVERYPVFQRDPELLVAAVHAGALCQITISSLAGQPSSPARRMAELLLLRNLGHVFGSDLHRLSERPPAYAAGLAAATELVGALRVWELTRQVPEAIIAGAPVAVPAIQDAPTPPEAAT